MAGTAKRAGGPIVGVIKLVSGRPMMQFEKIYFFASRAYLAPPHMSVVVRYGREVCLLRG